MMSLSTRSGISPAKMPTRLTADHHPIHRWFNFIAGFSPEFVESCVTSARGVEHGYVLDPFAGAGTTAVEAQALGLDSIGYEPHPFFAEMARAKIDGSLTSEDLDDVEASLVDATSTRLLPEEIWGPDALVYLRKLLSDEALSELSGVAVRRDSVEARLRPLFTLIGSRVVEAAAGAQTDGIYKAPASKKRARPVADSLQQVCEEIREDLARRIDAERASALLVERSSEEAIESGASICVTSPPYLNNFDFAEMTRMELYFWRLAESWRQITDIVRAKLLVNTTTVPPHMKRPPESYADSIPGSLFDTTMTLRRAVREAASGRSKDYDRLIFPYVGGLYAILTNCYTALNIDAPIHVVVADSAFYGVHVPLHELVAAMLKLCGFAEVSVHHLRHRGDRWVLAKRKGPPGRLGEYWIEARK